MRVGDRREVCVVIKGILMAVKLFSILTMVVNIGTYTDDRIL